MTQNVNPGSAFFAITDLEFGIQGSEKHKKAPDPGSATLDIAVLCGCGSATFSIFAYSIRMKNKELKTKLNPDPSP